MFRFGIRDVLWLTVVVAMAVAWYVQRVDSGKWRQRLEISTRREALSSHRLKWVDSELVSKGYDLRFDEESGTLGFYYIEPPLRNANRFPRPSNGD
jgi:hypothetical protein